MAETTTPAVVINEDERAVIRQAIESYGLGQLWTIVENYINDGWSDPDVILRQISENPDYQRVYFQRFPAVETLQKENAQRAARGEPTIAIPSAAQYVQMERGYAEVTRDLPGNWATKENITKWISSGKSVETIDQQVQTARNYINFNVNPAVRDELRRIYGLTDQDMMAYVLAPDADKERLASEFENRTRSANVGAAARTFGISISDSVRDQAALSSDSTYTFGQTAATFSNIAQQADDYARLGAISGVATSTDDLVRESFNLEGGTNTTKTKRKLASQERARFNRTSAIGSNSLATRGLGTQ